MSSSSSPSSSASPSPSPSPSPTSSPSPLPLPLHSQSHSPSPSPTPSPFHSSLPLPLPMSSIIFTHNLPQTPLRFPVTSASPTSSPSPSILPLSANSSAAAAAAVAMPKAAAHRLLSSPSSPSPPPSSFLSLSALPMPISSPIPNRLFSPSPSPSPAIVNQTNSPSPSPSRISLPQSTADDDTAEPQMLNTQQSNSPSSRFVNSPFFSRSNRHRLPRTGVRLDFGRASESKGTEGSPSALRVGAIGMGGIPRHLNDPSALSNFPSDPFRSPQSPRISSLRTPNGKVPPSPSSSPIGMSQIPQHFQTPMSSASALSPFIPKGQSTPAEQRVSAAMSNFQSAGSPSSPPPSDLSANPSNSMSPPPMSPFKPHFITMPFSHSGEFATPATRRQNKNSEDSAESTRAVAMTKTGGKPAKALQMDPMETEETEESLNIKGQNEGNLTTPSTFKKGPSKRIREELPTRKNPPPNTGWGGGANSPTTSTDGEGLSTDSEEEDSEDSSASRSDDSSDSSSSSSSSSSSRSSSTNSLSTSSSSSHSSSFRSPVSLRRSSSMSSSTPSSANGVTKCKCKRSKCLKLYCDCFARQGYCGEWCSCTDCNNCEERKSERDKAIQQTVERDPLAFFRTTSAATVVENNGIKVHCKGCSCKRSGCRKKYCECFQAGVKCADSCKCMECKNGKEEKEGMGERKMKRGKYNKSKTKGISEKEKDKHSHKDSHKDKDREKHKHKDKAKAKESEKNSVEMSNGMEDGGLFPKFKSLPDVSSPLSLSHSPASAPSGSLTSPSSFTSSSSPSAATSSSSTSDSSSSSSSSSSSASSSPLPPKVSSSGDGALAISRGDSEIAVKSLQSLSESDDSASSSASASRPPRPSSAKSSAPLRSKRSSAAVSAAIESISNGKIKKEIKT